MQNSLLNTQINYPIQHILSEVGLNRRPFYKPWLKLK